MPIKEIQNNSLFYSSRDNPIIKDELISRFYNRSIIFPKTIDEKIILELLSLNYVLGYCFISTSFSIKHDVLFLAYYDEFLMFKDTFRICTLYEIIYIINNLNDFNIGYL